MNFHVAVAPTAIDGDEYNAIRPALMTVACWRLDDIRFDFDSSFVLPEAWQEFRRLGELRKNYQDHPCSLFGHADPVGDDGYNKKLSGRRARTIYAVLTRKTEIWEQLHNERFRGDSWGLRTAQIILTAFGYYAGPTNGVMNGETQRALKDFSADKGPPATGKYDKGTRQRLYEEYFDYLCVDRHGKPFRIEPESFLGKGADKDGKADYQGCSEFNPILLFSKDQNKDFEKNPDKQPRNAANAPNRRVVLFFFPPGIDVEPKKWPCPTWNEGVSGCQKRFWSDSKRRLELTDETRSYKETRDTFACRFYDRLARRSPCEAGFREWVLRVFDTGPNKLKDRKPLAETEYVVTTSTGEQRGRTDAFGFLRVRVTDDPTELTLKMAGHVITLNGGALPDLDQGGQGMKHRLYNMGYGDDDLAKWDKEPVILTDAIKAFQRDFDLPEDGEVNDANKQKIREFYGS